MAVVGAGVTGLTAARHLAPSFDVVVVDKGRGVGGRLATRRIGDATFDHGAQFITTHTPDVAATAAGPRPTRSTARSRSNAGDSPAPL